MALGRKKSHPPILAFSAQEKVSCPPGTGDIALIGAARTAATFGRNDVLTGLLGWPQKKKTQKMGWIADRPIGKMGAFGFESSARLINLVDHEHFDGHVRGDQFHAELI